MQFLRKEESKRKNAIPLLQSFSVFREQYLDIHKDNDFPHNRFTFCTPELAFTVLAELASEWNQSKRVEKFGRVSVYSGASIVSPCSRFNSKLYGNVGNRYSCLGEKILAHSKEKLYLEINEDFNLNLKFDSEVLNHKLKEEVWKRLNNVQWPTFIHAKARQYKQGTHVPYEFDFSFLKEIKNIHKVAENLERTLDILIGVLR